MHIRMIEGAPAFRYRKPNETAIYALPKGISCEQAKALLAEAGLQITGVKVGELYEVRSIH